MTTRLATLAALLLLPAPARAAGERRLTVFYTAEVHGAVEPCGCTSDPLGDVSRYAALVKRARQETGAVLLLDAGDLLYPQSGISDKKREAADLKGRFLADEIGKLGTLAAGLGESDLARGPEHVAPRRLASNLTAPFVAPARVETVGGVKVGLLGVTDLPLARSNGWKIEDPVAAAKRDAQQLRRDGAELVVALAPVDRAVVQRLAKEAAVDFVVAGRQVGMGRARAQRVGDAWILTPGEELQMVGRLDVVLRPVAPGPLADAGSPEGSRQRLDEIAKTVAAIDAELERWAKSPGGDPAFIAARRQERAALLDERARQAEGWKPPAAGSYFMNRLVALRRALPQDRAVAASMKALDRKIASANLRAAEPPPKAEPGRASYVGMDACVKCHKTQAAYWKTTVHAHAWKTLVTGGKQADYDCVACHATGFGQVGGGSLGHTKGLEAVQCEVCHGPGSLHVAAEGNEDPPAVKREVPDTTCTTCHNEKHSDTFNHQAYLRDILGKGHGEQARAKLGEGVTGHELRSKALAEAKRKAALAAQN